MTGELIYTAPFNDVVVSNKAETVVEAEDMGYHANGVQSGEDWLLWSNGTMSEKIDFSQSDVCRFEITANGDLVNWLRLEMELLADAKSKGSLLVNTATQQVLILESEIVAVLHKFAIDFNNTFYIAAQDLDRNLFIDNIMIAYIN